MEAAPSGTVPIYFHETDISIGTQFLFKKLSWKSIHTDACSVSQSSLSLLGTILGVCFRFTLTRVHPLSSLSYFLLNSLGPDSFLFFRDNIMILNISLFMPRNLRERGLYSSYSPGQDVFSLSLSFSIHPHQPTYPPYGFIVRYLPCIYF